MLKNLIEALIFGSAKGLSYDIIKTYFGEEYTEKEMKQAINDIRKEYSGDKGIVLIEFNGKYQFQTNPIYGEKLSQVLRPIKEKELSATLLQTLSIVAYKQPITRLEIEEVRGGVSCDYAISVLLKLELIDIIGRKESLGRPALFGTTDNFLKRFQLKSLADLPDYEDLLEAAKNSDRYYKDTANLYRMDEESIADESTDEKKQEEYFEEIKDEKPDFLKDEDIVIIE